MKIAFALMISLLLVFAADRSLRAQTPVVLDENPPPMAAPRVAVKKSGTAAAQYEKLKDITYASSASISLKLRDAGWGSLSAGFTSKGNGVVKPESVKIHIFTAAKDRAYIDQPDVIVIADGKKLFEGKASIGDARTNGADIYGSFDVSIPLSDFVAITKAEKFGISLGPSAWWIPKEQISKFTDLLGLF